jgi:hypothetical protein
VSDAHCGAKRKITPGTLIVPQNPSVAAQRPLDKMSFEMADQDSIHGHGGHSVTVTGSMEKGKKILTVHEVERVGGKSPLLPIGFGETRRCLLLMSECFQTV